MKKTNLKETSQKSRFSFKDFFYDNENLITGIAMVLLFITGLFVSLFTQATPSSTSQFELYKDVAQYVYENPKESIIEVPEEVSVSTTATSIIVGSSSEKYKGYVVAELNNGELVITQHSDWGNIIGCAIAMGSAFILCSMTLFIVIFLFAEDYN